MTLFISSSPLLWSSSWSRAESPEFLDTHSPFVPIFHRSFGKHSMWYLSANKDCKITSCDINIDQLYGSRTHRQTYKSLNWWWLRLFRHCQWSFSRRYISAIYVYDLPRLRSTNFNRSNKRKWFHSKKSQEADGIPLKLWKTHTAKMIFRFSQIDLTNTSL